MPKRLTTEEFIEKARKVHGNKYDYSKVDLDNRDEKGRVCIICPEHGEFWQIPNSHLQGQGCKKCGYKKVSLRLKKTQDEFLKECYTLHGDTYDYSKVIYVNDSTKVEIVCHKKDKNGIEHGSFWQVPDNHLRGRHKLGQGCPKCAEETRGDRYRLTTEEFIEYANVIHNCKYDYSKVNYIRGDIPVIITCPFHGDFEQKPHAHLTGCGCQKCNTSKGELYIESFLIQNNIEFEKQKTFEWLIYKKPLKLDFYLPEYNIAIEFQGEQHYRPFRFSNKEKVNTILENIRFRDELKLKLCNEHNLPIEYILYNEDVNERLKEIINGFIYNNIKNKLK